MKTTHTPGPWSVINEEINTGPFGDYESSICGRDSNRVTKVFAEDCEPEVAQANAHLIAAAPELLHALEKIHANAAESPEWIRNVINQVLAKARGEQ